MKSTERDLPDENPQAERGAADYTASSITALRGLEPVRKRPHMYVINTETEGFHQLLWEVVDNSVDEAIAGYCRRIRIRIQADGSCMVTDDGRGIPVDIHPEERLPGVEVAMTYLHAGAKFEHRTYKVSGGLHGVGVSVTNALSEWLEVEIYRGGAIWWMRFERGKKTHSLEKRGKTDRTGTKVVFKPDRDIFGDLAFSYDTVARRCRELAFLTDGLEINLTDERNGGREETFHYTGGLKAFVDYLDQGKNNLTEVIAFTGDVQGTIVDIALQYHDGFTESVHSFANNINTVDGGTHLSGFRGALTRAFNNYAKQGGLLKGEEVPTGDDYREGLTAVVSVRIPDPQFHSQAKLKLVNREVQSVVEQLAYERLCTWAEEHPGDAKILCKKAILGMEAREAARKARDLKRKSPLSSGSLPGKLADCMAKDPEQTEIFIVEGDSAGGSAKSGRDREFQAILPLRGKILNVEKASLDKLLKHEEIKALITALGTGIHENFDGAKIRYGRIILMTDADVDGSHIRTLLLTFLYRHMVALIEAGRVYVAQPPLYRVRRKKNVRYIHHEGEMRAELLKLGIEGTALKVIGTGKTVADKPLADLVRVLVRLEECEKPIQRRGLRFQTYLEKLRDGRLPVYLVKMEEGEELLYDEADLTALYARWKKEHGDRDPVPFREGDDPAMRAKADLEVLQFFNHKEIEELVAALKSRGFEPDAYHLRPGRHEPPFALVSDGEEIPILALIEVPDAIRKLGQKGLDIQRYKGLGEMNPDQLWETTMDPEHRSLTRVKLEDAAAANTMFEILMGTNVEERRSFIERHALEVKDLDV